MFGAVPNHIPVLPQIISLFITLPLGLYIYGMQPLLLYRRKTANDVSIVLFAALAIINVAFLIFIILFVPTMRIIMITIPLCVTTLNITTVVQIIYYRKLNQKQLKIN